jgi:hypothetical protein
MQKQNELTNYSSQMYVHGSLLELQFGRLKLHGSLNLAIFFDKTTKKPKSNKEKKHDQTKNLQQGED